MTSTHRLKMEIRHVVILSVLTVFLTGCAGFSAQAGTAPSEICTTTTVCSCPPGRLLSQAFGAQRYCVTAAGCNIVPPNKVPPNQVLQGGDYLIQGGSLFVIHGKAACTTKTVCVADASSPS